MGLRLEAEGGRVSRLPFPWYFPLLLVLGWIALCGCLFSLWEPGWGFATSTYFVFISLSTIGLGDVVRSAPRPSSLPLAVPCPQVPTKPDLMLANFILLLIGLGLISMSFSVMQIRSHLPSLPEQSPDSLCSSIEELLEDMLQNFIDDFDRVGEGGKFDMGFNDGTFPAFPWSPWSQS